MQRLHEAHAPQTSAEVEPPAAPKAHLSRPRCCLRRRHNPHCGRRERGRGAERRRSRQKRSRRQRQPGGGGGGGDLPRGGRRSRAGVAGVAAGDGRLPPLRDGRRQRRHRPACACGQAKTDSRGGGDLRGKAAAGFRRSAAGSLGESICWISRGEGDRAQPRFARVVCSIVASAKPTKEGFKGSIGGKAGQEPVR